MIPAGMRWNENWELVKSETRNAETDPEVEEPIIPDDVRTMKLVQELANSITPGIKFTTDLPSANATGKAPMLDTAVWVEPGDKQSGTGDVIRYTFYEKPATAPLVFHARGAHPWRTKLQTLALEVDRRMCNMDRLATTDDRNEVLKTFIRKLKDSGYDHPTRVEILTSGLT